MNNLTVIGVGAVLVAVVGHFGLQAVVAKDPEGERYFEMRTYTAASGKMEALQARFRNHTNRLFIRHGITPVGYWTPADGEKASNTLVYILAYPSKESREKSWAAFQADPDWQKAKAESETNGKLVDKVESVFLKPTDYSPLK